MESEPLPGTSTRGIRQLQDDGGAQAGQGQRAQTENGRHSPKEKVRQRMQGCVIYKLHVLDACWEIVIFYFKFFLKNQILRVELSELFIQTIIKTYSIEKLVFLKKIWPHISLLGLHQYLLHFEHQF